jgi:hypothetical protein
VDVRDRFELNELETIWMFRFHTWHPAYPNGYNITLPGSQDYLKLGVIGGRIAVESGQLASVRNIQALVQKNIETGHIQALGRVYGRKAVESGRLVKICTREVRARGGRITGRNNVENGHLARLRTPEHQKLAGSIAGHKSVADKTGIHSPDFDKTKGGQAGAPIANHNRWHIRRGVSKPDTCALCRAA